MPPRASVQQPSLVPCVCPLLRGHSGMKHKQQCPRDHLLTMKAHELPLTFTASLGVGRFATRMSAESPLRSVWISSSLNGCLSSCVEGQGPQWEQTQDVVIRQLGPKYPLTLCASGFTFFGILPGPTSTNGAEINGSVYAEYFHRSRQTARV